MGTGRDLARAYPKRGLTADVGFRSEPTFCSDGAIEFDGYGTGSGGGPFINYSLNKTFSAFTVASWVLIDGNSTYNYFMSAGGGGSFGGVISFGWINGTTNPQLRLQDSKKGNAHIPSQTFPEVVNQWCHVACTINSAGDSIKMYVNGIEATGLTQPTSGNEVELPGSDGSSIAHFNVGSFQYSATKQALGIGGKMANFGLYDAELTQDQIIQLMRGNDFATCSAVATPAVFFELFENNTDSTGNALIITNTGTPYYGYAYAQLPRGLDLTRGAAQARFHTGRAVQFDGSADHLNAAVYSNSSDFYSVSVWINPDAVGANRNIVASGDTGDNAFLIFLHSTGVVYFYGNDTTGDYAIIHQTTLTAGRWYHLAMTVDQSDAANNTIKAYVDGVENTTSKSAEGWAGNSSAFEIAARNSATLFDGAIAGVKVFNSQLTAAQIQELYHNPEQVLPTGVSANNLRRYYPLSDYNDTGGTGGRYFQDTGADGEPAEDQGSATMVFAQPVPCPQLGLQQSATRLRFPTTTNNYVQASISPVGANFTLSYWVQPFSLHTGLLYQSTSGLQQLYTHSSGNVQVYAINQTYGGTATYTAGDWLHVVLTTDGLYVNGSLDAAKTGVSGLSESGIRIGADASSPNTNFGFNGIIASVGVWNEAITASEVSALYAQGQGYDPRSDTGNYTSSANLINLWLMDDLSTVVDRAGSSNATVTGSAFTAIQFPENASGSTLVGDISMKRKGASVLNCFNDPGAQRVRTEIPSGAGLQPSLTNGHTVSCWYRNQKRNTTSANNGTMVLGGNDGSNDRFLLEALNGNTFRGIYGAQTATSTATISDNEWHHYAMVLDVTTTSPTIRLYLDGVAAGTQSGTLSTTFPEGKVTIGGLNTTTTRGGFDYGLKGPIACPRIYAFQLSENEIKQIYHADERLMKGLNNE